MNEMNLGHKLSWHEFMELFPGLAPVVIPIAILVVAITVGAIISVLRKKLPFNQIAVWLAVILFISLFGPVIYFAIGSKMLDEKVQDGGDER